MLAGVPNNFKITCDETTDISIPKVAINNIFSKEPLLFTGYPEKR